MFSGIFYLCLYCWKFNKKYVGYLFCRQLIMSIITLLSLVLPKLIIDSLFVKKNMEETIYYVVAFVLIVSLFKCMQKGRCCNIRVSFRSLQSRHSIFCQIIFLFIECKYLRSFRYILVIW